MPIQSPQIQVDSRTSERQTLGQIGSDTYSVDDNEIWGHELTSATRMRTIVRRLPTETTIGPHIPNKT